MLDVYSNNIRIAGTHLYFHVVSGHLYSDKRQKINFPPASSGKQWEDLDCKIVLKIDLLLGKSTLEHKLAIFGDVVYQTCLDIFVAKQHQTKCPPQRSRR
ncbi:reverse transcriptase [Plakobranchus ocellatus]|uniref:Reverse transcriptase n=1 Tax=Plakobranchus ocellatus TaxID=259542 RepID=A0AAV4AHH8_9GAST|nr:reverse transcriptase [Plakobranchus ocellatus]